MKIEGTKVWGWENALIGMRLPMCNSYEEAKNKCDSVFYNDGSLMSVGESDLKVMKNLVAADSGTFGNGDSKTGLPNSKFLRMIHVQVCLTAPMYIWKEADTYKVGTVRNSSSTMHKLASTPITMDCFEMCDSFSDYGDMGFFDLAELFSFWESLIKKLEYLRNKYNATKDKRYWKELIRLLPESWLQTSILDLNYAVLRDIYCWRKNHKLTEWHTICEWIRQLPLAKELIVNDGAKDESMGI